MSIVDSVLVNCSAKVSDLPCKRAFSILTACNSDIALSARCACSCAFCVAWVALAMAVAKSAVKRSIFTF